MPKTKKIGRVEFETKGFKVVSLYKNEKPSGKYGIIAGKYLVSDAMSKKEAIDTLSSPDFKPKKKNKKFNF
jgi:hypothetical protein